MARVNDTCNILPGFSIDAPDAAWNGGQLVVDAGTLEAMFDKANGDVTVSKAPEPVVDKKFKNPDGELENILTGMPENVNDRDRPGTQFLAREQAAGALGAPKTVKAMEPLSRIGSLGAVPRMSIIASVFRFTPQKLLTNPVAGGGQTAYPGGLPALADFKASTPFIYTVKAGGLPIGH